MITIIGTIHVVNIEKQLTDLFVTIKPDVICIELDKQRYEVVEKILALPFGVSYKTDMFVAIRYAKDHNIPLKLIDKLGSGKRQSITRFLTNYQKLKLVCRYLYTIFFCFFLLSVLIFYHGRKMVSSINEYLSGEQNAPDYRQNTDLGKFLITERNEYMADSFQELHKAHQHIVAIVGDAHVTGICQHLMQKGISCNAIPIRQYFKEQVTIPTLFDLNSNKMIYDQFIAIVFLLVLILSLIVQ